MLSSFIPPVPPRWCKRSEWSKRPGHWSEGVGYGNITYRPYALLQCYIDSGGVEEALGICSFKYIVRAVHGRLRPSDMYDFWHACNDFKMFEHDFHRYVKRQDCVGLARKMMELDVLKDIIID